MTADKKELRRLAQAATPGPFSVLDMREPGGGFEAWLVKPCEVEKEAQRIISMSTKADAEYCAAMHPQQTLALLNEIEQLTESGTKTARAKNGEENSEPAEGFEPPTL